MRRRTQRGGWRTWVLGAVGATVAGAVLARRSGSLKQLRERGAARLRDAVASAAAAAGAMSVTSGAAARGAVAAPPSPVQGPPAADLWLAPRLGPDGPTGERGHASCRQVLPPLQNQRR